ncbi:MAG: heparan-alpha-glucosaminide N-acetyltransferase domain-containing protein [Aureliella sp.]
MAHSNDRLVSLDVFRGLTIAGMIVVNDPGSWSHVYAPLRHAPWHGLTPTDLVFPFFIFIVGISIVLSLSRRRDEGQVAPTLVGKILWRTAIIFSLGLFMWLFPKFDWSSIRIPGVLQRIALVYGACALLFLFTRWKVQLGLATVLLIGYCAIMQTIRVPIDETIAQAIETGEVATASGTTEVSPQPIPSGFSDAAQAVEANLEPGINLAAWIDRRTTPGRLWEKTWDPEGLFSTLPAIANGIVGMLLAQLLLIRKEATDRCKILMAAGVCLFACGIAWSWSFPLNKNLWSSSFVLATAGLASLTFGSLYWLVDVKKLQRWTYPFQVFGANAIAAYVLHGLIARLMAIPIAGWTIKPWFMDTLGATGLPLEAVSLMFALLYTLLIYLIVWLMYKRDIFLRV